MRSSEVQTNAELFSPPWQLKLSSPIYLFFKVKYVLELMTKLKKNWKRVGVDPSCHASSDPRD